MPKPEDRGSRTPEDAAAYEAWRQREPKEAASIEREPGMVYRFPMPVRIEIPHDKRERIRILPPAPADYEPHLCSHCNGSGEGMHDGARCSRCGGEGVL